MFSKGSVSPQTCISFLCLQFTHNCHCITGQYSTNIQHSIVGQIGEDVDDGDNGHRDGDGQRQVPGTGCWIIVMLFKDSVSSLLKFPSNKGETKGEITFQGF